MSKICPCCSGLPYTDCCEPFHQGQNPPTALQLMRSRYSAYALEKADYIQKTTHPKSPYYEIDKKKWRAGVLEFCRTTRFVKLEILGCGEDWVSFAAHLQQNSESFTLLEKSHFEQVDARWLYVSGDVQKVIRP